MIKSETGKGGKEVSQAEGTAFLCASMRKPGALSEEQTCEMSGVRGACGAGGWQMTMLGVS